MESDIRQTVMRRITSTLVMLMAAVAVMIVSNLQTPDRIQEDQSLSIVTNDILDENKENFDRNSIVLSQPEEEPKEQREVASVSLLSHELRTATAVSEYDNQVLADVNESLNVRNQPSVDGEIIGKMPKGSSGEVIEKSNGFTKIKSGSVEGWVSDEFLIFGAEIETKAKELGLLKAEVITETLKIRKYADAEAPTLTLCGSGDIFTVLEEGDWIKIQYTSDEIGYIASEYAKVGIKLLTARTLEEEQAAIKAEEQKAAAQKIKNASSEQEINILAACVMMEAGSQSYDGQLAVANVILNRVKSGRWGSSIKDVIYAKGQFPGASSGLLDSYLAKGPSGSALKAVKDAMNGVNNVGSFLFFNSAGSADYGSYSEYVVIGGNCFYKR